MPQLTRLKTIVKHKLTWSIYAGMIAISGCAGQTRPAASCEVTRGAIDMGSGSTKGLVANLNTCTKKIVKVVFESQRKISFGEAFEKSGDGKIPDGIVQNATSELTALVSEMKKNGAESVGGVATAVFRKASNGADVVHTLSDKSGAEIHVITQDQEAELGYWSAVAQGAVPANDPVLIWDIGGSSMQMFARGEKKNEIYRGDLASVSFKNQVIEKFQRKDPKTSLSPNPLGPAQKGAVKLAEKHAIQNVPEYFKTHAVRSRWVGIGGVLAMSIPNQVKKDPAATLMSYRQVDLETALKTRAKLTDPEISSAYRATDVTNIALVLGYMKALKIDRVEPVEATLTQGYLTQSLNESAR